MRVKTFSFVHGCAVSIALLGIVGCAMGEQSTESASDEVAVNEVSENLDPELAAQIAKVKLASLGDKAITPQAAGCGTNGPTGTSERVNDAAFTGTANQRTGSSTGCTARGALQPTDDALYFCFTFAGDGTWTFAQNIRTGVRGWTRDDLLRPPPGAIVGGARNGCGF